MLEAREAHPLGIRLGPFGARFRSLRVPPRNRFSGFAFSGLLRLFRLCLGFAIAAALLLAPFLLLLLLSGPLLLLLLFFLPVAGGSRGTDGFTVSGTAGGFTVSGSRTALRFVPLLLDWGLCFAGLRLRAGLPLCTAFRF